MIDEESGQLLYARYADFLTADPRRRGDALELGANWEQEGALYRACWYEQTGELTLERLARADPLAAEDFYQGVSGPVEILGRVGSRDELERLLGRWPNVAPREPRTIRRLRELVAGKLAEDATHEPGARA